MRESTEPDQGKDRRVAIRNSQRAWPCRGRHRGIAASARIQRLPPAGQSDHPSVRRRGAARSAMATSAAGASPAPKVDPKGAVRARAQCDVGAEVEPVGGRDALKHNVSRRVVAPRPAATTASTGLAHLLLSIRMERTPLPSSRRGFQSEGRRCRRHPHASRLVHRGRNILPAAAVDPAALPGK